MRAPDCLGRTENESDTVHAVTQAGRVGAIVEDVA